MKYAIAGAGYIANVHAQAVINQGGQVTCVVEKFSEKSAAFREKLGIAPHCCATIEDALLEPDFDALIVATPNYLHAPQTIAALKAGIAVMVEKPMAMNAAEAAQMLAASRASGASLMVAHCWRFDNDVLWLKEQVEKLGKIIRTRGLGVHTNWGPGGWFTQKQFAGGGALADMGVHAIDTARFLLGDPRPVSVYARIGTYYGKYDVDDTGLLVINWDNGTVSIIESGWWQPHADGPEAATQLYGERGFAQLFPTRLELVNRPALAEGEVKVIEVDPGFPCPREEHCPQSMYDAQMNAFAEYVRSGQTPVPGGIEGLWNMKVVDAAVDSSRTGQVVTIVEDGI